jgi:hypothetical protein
VPPQPHQKNSAFFLINVFFWMAPGLCCQQDVPFSLTPFFSDSWDPGRNLYLITRPTPLAMVV